MTLWVGAVALVALAWALRRRDLVPAAKGSADPFLTLGAVILAAVLADRFGVFRFLVRVLVPDRASRTASVIAILGLTALLSATVNLDVAVVVAMPLALGASRRIGVSADLLAATVAITANASSFLLPTSNVTNLLLLDRAHLSARAYIRDSWLAWLLVAMLTVGVLTIVVLRRGGTPAGGVQVRLSASAIADLLPMFLAASAIRALLGAGLVLHGTFLEQVAAGSVLASAVNNLPAASAVRVVGPAGRWAGILSMDIGPNLLITGSVATLICRRLARDGGARLTALEFSIIGLGLVPAQLAVAFCGLRMAGALR